jgi:hypothetical protein
VDADGERRMEVIQLVGSIRSLGDLESEIELLRAAE